MDRAWPEHAADGSGRRFPHTAAAPRHRAIDGSYQSARGAEAAGEASPSWLSAGDRVLCEECDGAMTAEIELTPSPCGRPALRDELQHSACEYLQAT